MADEIKFKFLEESFLPGESQNTIMELWGFDEDKLKTKCIKLEKDALAIIKAKANLTVLEAETDGPLSMLCESYVTAKLLDKFVNRGYRDTVESHLADFWDTLNAIRSTQKEEKVSSEEEVGKTPVIGIMVF